MKDLPHKKLIRLMKKNPVIWAQARVIRVISYWPAHSNQIQKKGLFYDCNGSVIFVYENIKYVSIASLRTYLPQRMVIIEDNTPHKSLKEYDYYKGQEGL